MKKNCPDPGEFDHILGLEKSDPRRLHLEECPKCRMILESQRAFEAQPELSDEENTRCQDADLKMTAFLQDTLFASNDTEKLPDRNQARHSPRSKTANFFTSFRQSPFGLPGAMAAILVCALGIWAIMPSQVNQSTFPGTIQSGSTRHGGENKLPVEFSSPLAHVDNQGVLTLQWTVLDDAETYQIIFWTDSLEKIKTVSTGTETTASFSDPLSPIPTESRFFCVIALKDNVEIGRSDVVGLP